jgi:hypothetical protein
VGDRLRIEFSAICIRSAENNNEIVSAVLISNLFDTFLTFQVKGACCRSNKTLGLNQHRFRSSAFHTRGNGRSLDAISFSDNHHTFSLELHVDISSNIIDGV